jgi:hypothetical protein
MVMKILFIALLLSPLVSFGQNDPITYEYHNLTDKKIKVHETHYDIDTTIFQSVTVLYPDSGHIGYYNSVVTYSIYFFRSDVIAIDFSSGDTIFSQTYLLGNANGENLKIEIQNGILEKSKTLYPNDRIRFSILGFNNTKDYHLIFKTGDKLNIQFNGNENLKGELIRFDSNTLALIDKKGIKHTVKTDNVVGLKMRKYLLYFPGHSFLGHSKYYSLDNIMIVRQIQKHDENDNIFWTWE